MPLTLLEKQWLKAIADDPHVKLFGVEIPELDDVEPLFTIDDYRIYEMCIRDRSATVPPV